MADGVCKGITSNPNAAYEAALRRFVLSVLDAGRTNPFLDEFHAFVGTLARPGAVASLAQLALVGGGEVQVTFD